MVEFLADAMRVMSVIHIVDALAECFVDISSVTSERIIVCDRLIIRILFPKMTIFVVSCMS